MSQTNKARTASVFASPDPAFAAGTTHAGFTVTKAEALPELEAQVYHMTHSATGARLMWIACADDNKSFSIAFKTPPTDDTGVFHILEHSVLCGSERFPVKEPFVNLLKSSMQTFLNALTFSDKTMYPVASTNERDLKNLIDVYLDAVLSPKIYENRRIFEQEGWHFELDDEQNLRYNGVVFNEMKGALSDPESVLMQTLMARLFPDTAYGWESGGNPRAIPQLTYENFLDNHARHYRLDNSYTILYGNINASDMLSFIDERFCTVPTRDAAAPNPLNEQAPLQAPLHTQNMATAPENALVGLGYIYAKATERERVLATTILFDTLMGSNEAPLKRRLLEADLGQDVVYYPYDGILQPMLLFMLKGAKPNVAQEFRELIESSCAEIVASGVPVEQIEASLDRAEFNLREGDMSYADGVGYSIAALSGWLYNDEDPISYLRFEEAFAHMREGLTSGYFERLLDEVICSSEHSALVDLVPTEEGDAQEELAELAQIQANMTEDDLANVVAETQALRVAQETPDAPEDLERLPQLPLSAVGEDKPESPWSEFSGAPFPCIHHDIPTRGIAYTNAYFELTSISAEDLPYLSILGNLLGKLDTEKHSARELDSLTEGKLGNLSFHPSATGSDDDLTQARVFFTVSSSSLDAKLEWLAQLPAEIWSSTRFDDTERIQAILQQRRISLEQAFMNAGHSCAIARASAHFSASARIAEELSGVEFYFFLKDLLDNFDERAAELSQRLTELCGRIFTRNQIQLSFTGTLEQLERFFELGGDFSLSEHNAEPVALELDPLPQRNEAFVVPSNVCYVSRVADARARGGAASGLWAVAARPLTYDYLWNEVRVKGGAYGCGFNLSTNALLRQWSYRDPAIDPTLERFAASSDWLAEWNPSEREFEGYVVSCVASHDAPVKPRIEAARQDSDRIAGRPADIRAQRREEELAATPDTIRDLAEVIKAFEDNGVVVVFGGKDIVAASKEDFETVELMGAV